MPDRIVERAILSVLTPLIDPLLGPSSFAYRPGLGVIDAVQEVARLRDEGFSHVLRTDVADCFPTIQVDRLSRILDVVVLDSDLLAIVSLLLTRPLRGPGRRRNRPGVGLPQGSLCEASHNPPYEQRWVMCSAGRFPLVRKAAVVERCA